MTVTIETQKLKSCPMHRKLLNKLKVARKPKVATKLPSNLWKGLFGESAVIWQFGSRHSYDF